MRSGHSKQYGLGEAAEPSSSGYPTTPSRHPTTLSGYGNSSPGYADPSAGYADRHPGQDQNYGHNQDQNYGHNQGQNYGHDEGYRPDDGYVPRGHDRGRWSSIGGRIMSRSLLLASVPILALGAVTVLSLLVLANNAQRRIESTRLQLTTETAGEGRAQQAASALRGTDLFVDERLNDIIDWTRAEPVMTAANLRRPEADEMASLPTELVESQNPPGTVLDESATSTQFLRNQIIGQPLYDQVLLTDSNGFTVGTTKTPDRFAHKDQAWWEEAWLNGAYVGPITVDQDGTRLTFVMALRVDLPSTRNPVGVIRAVVDATVLQEYANDLADDGAGVDIRLITADGIILADTASGNDPSVIGSPITLDEAVRAAFDQLDAGATENGFVAVDDAVVGFARSDAIIPAPQVAFDVPSPRWIAVARQPMSMALAPLADVDRIGEDLNSSVWSQSLLVLAIVALTIGLAWLGARRLANSIALPINQLRYEAIRVADHELPTLVSSIAAGYDLDDLVGTEPIEVDAEGELADLAIAFNTLQSTATDLAAAQALGRNRDVAAVLLNLGRRNQQLIGRQLRYIDQLERDESDPDTLRNLFLLDQMATRMRRNAESLLVLAGEDPPRRGTKPRPPEEILRAAISEVEDYARVTITAVEPARIRPNVISDLTHLLAELIENSTNFSAPETTILVSGEREASGGYTISVIDRGIGMSPDRLAQANSRISDPSFTNDAPTSFLGLYVVGRLAARHHITVRLVESGSAGVAATVTVPPDCLVEDPTPAPVERVRPMTDVPSRGDELNDGQQVSSWPAPAIRPATAKVEHRPGPGPGRDQPITAPTPITQFGGDVAQPITAPTPAIRPPSVLPPSVLPAVGPEPDDATEPDRALAALIEHLPKPGDLLDSGPGSEPDLGPYQDGTEPRLESSFVAEATPETAVDTAEAAETDAAGPDLFPGPSSRSGSDISAPSPTSWVDAATPSSAAFSSGARPGDPGVERREDDTDGLPIPPFRARQSRRPEPGSEDASQPQAHPPQTFQVKRRVPGQALAQSGQQVGHDNGQPDHLIDEPGAGGSPGGNPVSRATEVRDKLTRFAIGVGAARADTAAAARSSEPSDESGNISEPGGTDAEPAEGPQP